MGPPGLRPVCEPLGSGVTGDSSGDAGDELDDEYEMRALRPPWTTRAH